MHVRADIIEAFENTLEALPVVGSVYDFVAVSTPPRPPKNKAIVELQLALEGENTRIDGGYLPSEAVLDRPIFMSARVTANVPRDMTGKEFERNVVAPIETAVATCEPLKTLCNSWILQGIELEPEMDGQTETLSAVMVWKLTYSTLASAPGKAL
jgi:hypothetical protein